MGSHRSFLSVRGDPISVAVVAGSWVLVHDENKARPTLEGRNWGNPEARCSETTCLAPGSGRRAGWGIFGRETGTFPRSQLGNARLASRPDEGYRLLRAKTARHSAGSQRAGAGAVRLLDPDVRCDRGLSPGHVHRVAREPALAARLLPAGRWTPAARCRRRTARLRGAARSRPGRLPPGGRFVLRPFLRRARARRRIALPMEPRSGRHAARPAAGRVVHPFRPPRSRSPRRRGGLGRRDGSATALHGPREGVSRRDGGSAKAPRRGSGRSSNGRERRESRSRRPGSSAKSSSARSSASRSRVPGPAGRHGARESTEASSSGGSRRSSQRRRPGPSTSRRSRRRSESRSGRFATSSRSSTGRAPRGCSGAGGSARYTGPFSTHPWDAHVAGIAESFGFRHLGQFAADYRELFGELPSETIRRAPSRGGELTGLSQRWRHGPPAVEELPAC